MLHFVRLRSWFAAAGVLLCFRFNLIWIQKCGRVLFGYPRTKHFQFRYLSLYSNWILLTTPAYKAENQFIEQSQFSTCCPNAQEIFAMSFSCEMSVFTLLLYMGITFTYRSIPFSNIVVDMCLTCTLTVYITVFF